MATAPFQNQTVNLWRAVNNKKIFININGMSFKVSRQDVYKAFNEKAKNLSVSELEEVENISVNINTPKKELTITFSE